jgi:hypothetical protein
MADAPSAPRVFSDALLVAGFTASSYAVGYAYRSGFAEHFGVPTILLAPTVTTVLEAAAALGGVLFAYFAAANYMWTLVPHTNTAVARAVKRFVAFILCMGFLLFPVAKVEHAWGIFAGTMLFLGFLEFVLPLLTQRHAGTYEEKLEAQYKFDRQVHHRSLLGHSVNAFGRDLVLFVLFVIVIVLAAKMLGLRNAKEKEEFYLLSGVANSVVVSLDGEVLVLANFDPKTKTLSGTYIVRKLSDGKPWSLRLERIGPLKSLPKTKEKWPNAKP